MIHLTGGRCCGHGNRLASDFNLSPFINKGCGSIYNHCRSSQDRNGFSYGRCRGGPGVTGPRDRGHRRDKNYRGLVHCQIGRLSRVHRLAIFSHGVTIGNIHCHSSNMGHHYSGGAIQGYFPGRYHGRGQHCCCSNGNRFVKRVRLRVASPVESCSFASGVSASAGSPSLDSWPRMGLARPSVSKTSHRILPW